MRDEADRRHAQPPVSACFGRYRFTQFQVTVPDHYDVAGAGLIGSPVVIIGHGGEGFAGNANAVPSRLPAANLKRLHPISYGRSGSRSTGG